MSGSQTQHIIRIPNHYWRTQHGQGYIEDIARQPMPPMFVEVVVAANIVCICIIVAHLFIIIIIRMIAVAGVGGGGVTMFK